MKKKIVFLISFLLFTSYSTDSLAMEFDMLDNVDIHGFISQGYLKSTENNFFAETVDGTPQFNEMGINFSTDITERLRMGVQFFARDMGSIGNNEVILDWAIADYRFKDWLGIRAGNMKYVNGLYNETRDIDMIRTNIFLPQSIYNEAWRESSTLIQGMGLYGEIPIGTVGSLSYDGQYGTISLPPDKGAARLAEDQWPLGSIAPDLLVTAEQLQAAAGGLTVFSDYIADEYETPAINQVNRLQDKLASSQDIELISIDTKEVDVDQAYSGRILWNTPLDGLVVGCSTLGYTFQMKMDSAISSEAMQTLAAARGLSGMAEDLSDLNPDNQSTWGEYFQSAESIEEGFTDYGVDFDSYPTKFKADVKTYVASLEYTWRSLILAGEYMRTDYKLSFQNDLFKDPTIGTLLENASDFTTVNPGSGKMTVNDFNSMGWYVSSAYRFTYWFELGLYYSEYYPDEDDQDGKIRVNDKKIDNEYHRGWLKDTCMTLRFDITENWVGKLEGHSMNGAAVILGADNPSPIDGSERYEEDWMLFAAKLTYSF